MTAPSPTPALQRLQIALIEFANEVGLPEPDPDRVAVALRGRTEPLVLPCAARMVPLKPSEAKILETIRGSEEPLMLKELRSLCKLGSSTVAAAVAELQRRQLIRHVPDEGYESAA